MNTLTIDIGNNRVKADVWDDEGLLFQCVYDDFDASKIADSFKQFQIEGIIVASVRSDSEKESQKLLESFPGAGVVNFNNDLAEGFYATEIKYSGKIGVDRVAAYLGAEVLLPSRRKLIIDAGTAITFDLTDSDKNFRGGNISLGYRSRLKALADAAALLPDVGEAGSDEKFGRDTVSAIISGAKNGVVGEVLYTVNLAFETKNLRHVIVTGGDAKIFFSELEKKFSECIYDEYLVGRGLNDHLRKVMAL